MCHPPNFAAMMSTEEQRFVEYWRENRLRRRKIYRQLAIGLPMATLLVVAIFANYFSSWYKKAEMVRNQVNQQNNGSQILILIVAALFIVVFIVIFGARHKWDQHEQRYRELLAKEGQEDAAI